jgi:DNA-binding Lrp family transcriptional regulator
VQTLFVHFKCELGQSYKVAGDLADNIAALSALYSISGQYDLLAQFRLEPDTDIGLFITEVVQRIPGVRDTHTTIAHNAFTPRPLPPELNPGKEAIAPDNGHSDR